MTVATDAALDAVRALYARQVQLLSEEQRRIERRLSVERVTDPNFQLSKDMRATLSQINQFLMSAGKIALQLEADEKPPLTAEELEKQFRSELMRMAHMLSEEEWEKLDQIRAGKPVDTPAI